jgi:hypothetical protein
MENKKGSYLKNYSDHFFAYMLAETGFLRPFTKSRCKNGVDRTWIRCGSGILC